MFGIGETELVIIIVFAFLLFGPERLPGMGRTVGRAIRQFRNAQDNLTKVVQAEVAPVSDAASDPAAVARAAKATLTGEDLEAAAEAERQAKQERLEAETHKETFAERRARLAAEREAAQAEATAQAQAQAPAAAEDDAQPAAPAPAPETVQAEPAPAPEPAAPATSASALYGLATPLASEVAAEEPSVIIARRPCALLKYVKHPGPIRIDRDKCVGCRACMKIGCPAISITDGKAQIDNTLCVGCGLCTQMCRFDAIEE